MNKTKAGTVRSDALVLFGVTGDLVHKKIFPALYAMVKGGVLDVPVVGVASAKWSLAQLRKRAEDGIRKTGRIGDRSVLRHLLSLLRYVNGDYNDPGALCLSRPRSRRGSWPRSDRRRMDLQADRFDDFQHHLQGTQRHHHGALRRSIKARRDLEDR